MNAARIKRLLAALFVVLIVVPVAVSAAGRFSHWFTMIPLEELQKADVHSLAVRRDDAPGQSFAESTVTDPEALRLIVASLSTSEPATDHKCASVGYLVFKAAKGRRLHCSILPGHDERHYEIRIRGRGTLRVERKAFMNAMKAAGIDWLPENCP
jgi:hypothetical protein